MSRLKSLLPRGLVGRAALILIVPIVTIQLVVSTAFIQRHFEGVTRQMTQGVAIDLSYVLDAFAHGGDASAAYALARERAGPLEIALRAPAPAAAPHEDERQWLDVSGRAIIETFHRAIPAVRAVDVADPGRIVRLRIETPMGEVQAELSRRRLSATNPHQLLVVMLATSVLMTLIAYLFLRNQLRPIARLARAAEAFGRGERLEYRPRGALEVRAAGRAFLEMRARIERQIEQRTLLLSGVSHDLRTPLTRLRLALELQPPGDEVEGMREDVAQMERLVDEFLAFVRGDATEGEEPCDLVALVEGIVLRQRAEGVDITLLAPEGVPRAVSLRAQAVSRALANLVENAHRHARRITVRIVYGVRQVAVVVEDDGPGIPEERRDEALHPFARLGSERDPNRGGGLGLGLSIASDVATSHGGAVRLSESTTLGGLRVDLVLAR